MKGSSVAAMLICCGLISACGSFPGPSDYTTCQLPTEPFQIQSVTAGSGEHELDMRHDARDALLSSGHIKFAPELPAAQAYSHCVTGAVVDALVISGGGADGAYGNGFLQKLIAQNQLGGTAWGQSITDPTGTTVIHPCVVTGVSAGAVLAPYVYLASSPNPATRAKYLPRLQTALFMSFTDSLLVQDRGIRALVSPAKYDVSKLKAYIQQLIKDDQVLTDITREYLATNRRIMVGATNIMSGKFEVIYLDELAASAGNPNYPGDVATCFGASIRASAAIPVTFDPVAIHDIAEPGAAPKDKIYVDGGARRMFFLGADLFNRVGPHDAAHRIFAVVNNTFILDIKQPPLNILDIAENSAKIAADQLYRDDITQLGDFSSLKGRNIFWSILNSQAEETNACANTKSASSDLFPHAYEVCLYQLGEEHASRASPWHRH